MKTHLFTYYKYFPYYTYIASVSAKQGIWEILLLYKYHCVKSVYLEFLRSVFSRIRAKYAEMLRISPCSIRMRENMDQKNSEYGHFSHGVCLSLFALHVYEYVQNHEIIVSLRTAKCGT